MCSDLIKRREFLLTQVKFIVLDWAEELLSSGFKDQIYDLFQHLPPTVHQQVCLFSATMTGTNTTPACACCW